MLRPGNKHTRLMADGGSSAGLQVVRMPTPSSLKPRDTVWKTGPSTLKNEELDEKHRSFFSMAKPIHSSERRG